MNFSKNTGYGLECGRIVAKTIIELTDAEETKKIADEKASIYAALGVSQSPNNEITRKEQTPVFDGLKILL